MRGETADGPHYVIREVYYDADDKVDGWTEEDAAPFGETFDELIGDLAWIATALAKPILCIETGAEVEPARVMADDLERIVLGKAKSCISGAVESDP
jgi:hypothetical protein